MHQMFTHLDVFNSFYQTVANGESHRIIYKEILLWMVNPFFRIWASPQKSPKQVHVISTAHHPPPYLRKNSKKHLNAIISN